MSADHTEFDRFAASLSFELDDFQRLACHALEDGQGVLVCAPTGAGKTIVGEFAVHLALADGTKCFYTTPIKALSNQKYADLVAVHGRQNVGLLTGDSSINSDAPVVVMTTEVVRNMIYANSPALQGLSHVVMDEVHFLADRFRGAVWEEVILGLDPSVRVVSLSATVSNAEEFGDWIQTVRGEVTVIVDEHRPVPLQQHMLVGSRMFDLFDPHRDGGKPQVNPELKRYIRHRMLLADDRDSGRGHDRRSGRGRPRQTRGRGPGALSRPQLVARLDREGLLPAIGFIFSRVGCDAALAQCLRSGLSLLTPEESSAVDEVIDRHLTEIAPGDADVLGVDEWRAGLRRGFAAHHAGLLPTFRHTVEELFVRGLVRMVFATETLALGINMPARSVVLERLVKFNGESHVDLTPGEFTQLTGRAGRRGIDVEGHAVVVWTPELVPEQVAGLAGARTFPLRSSFAPEYNMAVNLIGRRGLAGSRELLNRSFAQFQADRSVVGQSRKVDDMYRRLRKLDVELAGAADKRGIEPGTITALDDDPSDGADDGSDSYRGFLGYVTLREEIRRRERDLKFRSRVATQESTVADLAGLKRGHVIGVSSGRHRGLAVVLEAASQPADPKPLVLSEDAWCGRVGTRDFVNPPEVLGHMRLPKNPDRRTGRGRRDLASALRSTGIEMPRGRQKKRALAADDTELARMRHQLRAHPAHQLDNGDDLFRLAEQRNRLVRDIVSAERSISERTSTLGVTFDRIVGVLTELGYVESDRGEVVVTPTGQLLSRIYSESDLLVTECIRAGIWDRLGPPQLAAVVAAMVFESRRDSHAGADAMPGNVELRTAIAETLDIWGQVTDVERRHGVSPTREPDTGFSVAVSLWASGRSLTESLAAAGERGTLLSPGDFVRWNRQVVDLLEQIRLGVGDDAPLARSARAAVGAIRRGVVAAELG
ncbi:DEAD/DEAH box helicase [Gordonia sp. 852002-50816_SCH5313054-c]|uniref:DEAD/DEAH box helicase n=1 Tax=unclassified Gordonia (in: high G+C Gram-positive bacteria) TaxID=2657482 RepID=UPI0007E9F03D|nr:MULTISPECIES: DEAD/DEAH box helicase [unclassified Gordonia (in: high G+C Gram-positive bacteria)]OBC15182.1 DEAD/DEAH box helicase [Gordonia sp. 852002-50816_SCH5313054-c]OBC15273.1 DEAD/DEAH box helicase [Gordonia sp. 852002-50816_SCH5313054-a]